MISLCRKEAEVPVLHDSHVPVTWQSHDGFSLQAKTSPAATVEAVTPSLVAATPPTVPTTPSAVGMLSKEQQEEYRRLRKMLQEKYQHKKNVAGRKRRLDSGSLSRKRRRAGGGGGRRTVGLHTEKSKIEQEVTHLRLATVDIHVCWLTDVCLSPHPQPPPFLPLLLFFVAAVRD